MPIDSVVPKNAQNYQVATYNGVPYISYQINNMQNIIAPFQDTYVSVGYDAKPVSAGDGLGGLNCTLDAIGELETCAGKKGATEADKEACHKTFENDIAACKGSKIVVVIGKKQ